MHLPTIHAEAVMAQGHLVIAVRFVYAKKLNFRAIRQACAILLSTQPISDCVPVMLGDSYLMGEMIPVVQYEKWHAEDAGLFKINLGKLDDGIELVVMGGRFYTVIDEPRLSRGLEKS